MPLVNSLPTYQLPVLNFLEFDEDLVEAILEETLKDESSSHPGVPEEDAPRPRNCHGL
ncbi:hypothetical protein IMZ48_40950 [Candidatus Bathyarchaeota archaeon]|nr:hypothetical protein [Candidatus Bathyarchaeota archaeon]